MDARAAASPLDGCLTGDTITGMDTVTIRDLRNHGGDVIDRVAAGNPVTITRDGRPVAELRPLRPVGLTASALLARWRHVPIVDGDRLRRDIDAVIDQRL
jgi:prevent-host-death family protein